MSIVATGDLCRSGGQSIKWMMHTNSSHCFRTESSNDWCVLNCLAVSINTGIICSTYQHRGGSCKLQVEHLHWHSQATTQRTLGRISPERLTARSVDSGEKDPKTLMWSTHCAVEQHRRYSSFTGNVARWRGCLYIHAEAEPLSARSSDGSKRITKFRG